MVTTSKKKKKYNKDNSLPKSPHISTRMVEQKNGTIPILRNRQLANLKMNTLSSVCTCTACELQFLNNSELFNHWIKEHPGRLITYRCNEEEEDCNFITEDALTMKCHLKEHMFKLGLLHQCNLCSKPKYYTKSHLRIHKKNYHSEDSFTCPVCQASFKSSGCHLIDFGTRYSQVIVTCLISSSVLKFCSVVCRRNFLMGIGNGRIYVRAPPSSGFGP